MATRDDPIRRFCDKQIVDYNPRRGISKPLECAYRFTLVQYDDEWRNTWRSLLHDAQAAHCQALVLNVVHENDTQDAGYRPGEDVVELVVRAQEHLTGLKGLYLDDSSNMKPRRTDFAPRDLNRILEAYPLLESLGAREGVGGQFEPGMRHRSLRELICDTDLGNHRSLPISEAHFPALEHLELWMTVKSLDYFPPPDSLSTVFSGEQFPNLTYLGLRDCGNVPISTFVASLMDAPIVEQLETLDLSWSGLGDRGCKPLLECPLFTRLGRLDLRGNNLSKEMVSKLKKAKLPVDGSDQRKQTVVRETREYRRRERPEDRYDEIRE